MAFDYNKTYDIVDGLGIMILALVGAVLSGIATVSLFGYSASGVVTVAGFGLTYAFVIGSLTLVGLAVYNDVGIKDLKDAKNGSYGQQQEDLAGVVIGVVVLAGLSFVTEVQNFVTSNDVIAISATLLVVLPALIIVHRLS